MKSTEKENKRSYWSILGLAIGLALAAGLLAQSESDILDFYWDRSAQRFAEANPGATDLSYRIHTFSYYKKVARRGEESIADSAVIDFYLTGDRLDSQVVRVGELDRFRLVDPVLPDIYAYEYTTQLFPNDDGLGELAIGLDTDSADVFQPTGLLMIDRSSYQMTDLYLYYQSFDDFLRFSRSYQLMEQAGYLFPDSVWIVAAKHGLLQPEHFRIETDIREIELLP